MTMTKINLNVTTPVVHLNGSGRDGLMRQYHDAYMALHRAIVSLRECYPHDRDYYVLGPDVGPKARREHQERLLALEKVQAEINEILVSVSR